MENDEEDDEEERERRMKESTIRTVEAKKSKGPVKELPVSLMIKKVRLVIQASAMGGRQLGANGR
jgi:hypothetical protein